MLKFFHNYTPIYGAINEGFKRLTYPKIHKKSAGNLHFFLLAYILSWFFH